MKRLSLLLVICCFVMAPATAQKRYLDKIFSGVTVSSDVKYAENISVLTGTPMKIDLNLDVYEPTGDTASKRPVVLMFGTGNFLPPVINGGPFGSKTDSAMVEMCREFAMRGYVAMAVQYRQGWNPISSDDNVRRSTLLQAAYRGIHDCRAAIRYLKKTVAEDGNTHGIDTSMIVVGGMGTGGYISLGSAFLNEYSEIVTLSKFINLDTSTPYVIESVHGNVYGTNTGLLPIDTLGNTIPFSLPNYPTYSSDFAMAFHMGGALGDSSWIDAGEIPVVSIHSPQDVFAPYSLGNVIVPVTGEIVIGEAAGGGLIQKIQKRLGNNDTLYKQGFNDPITLASNSDLEALYAFNTKPAPAAAQCITGQPMTPGTPDAGPWNWYNETWFIAAWDQLQPQPIPGSVANCISRQGNLNDPAESRLFIDTAMQYLTPRIMWATGIQTDLDDEILKQNLRVFPNPAADLLNIQNTDAIRQMEQVTLMDLTGRVVYSERTRNVQRLSIDLSPLPSGIYLLEVQATKGRVTQKIVVE